jgi:hypothetical protein
VPGYHHVELCSFRQSLVEFHVGSAVHARSFFNTLDCPASNKVIVTIVLLHHVWFYVVLGCSGCSLNVGTNKEKKRTERNEEEEKKEGNIREGL